MKKIILVIALLLVFPAQATEWSKYQILVLSEAMYYGNRIGFPETLQAIVLQESLLGIVHNDFVIGDIGNGFGKRSYGVCQVKLATAQFVIKYFDLPIQNFPEELLIARLITDRDFNLMIASHYFKYLYGYFQNWEAAVVAYNRGPGWVEKNREKVSGNKYLQSIRQLILNKVRPFNEKSDK